MNLMVPRGELMRQADVARGLGSAFVAAVLAAGQRQLDHAPLTARLIETWPADPSAAALAMRFNAAMHALARSGARPELTALYEQKHGDFDGAIGRALAAEDGFVSTWMRDTPQTNEIGRSAAIAAALMVASAQFGLPFELLDIGSSCGLNLNLANYAYDLGSVRAGAVESAIVIAPIWHGSPPDLAQVEIVSARGSDLNPLSADDVSTRDRLLAYVWADQPHRAHRLERALACARRYPPQVDRASAGPWLAERLALPQAPGSCRVVFHSMVLQYLTAKEREAVVEAIRRAGVAASAERPFAWIRFEWTPTRSEVELWLTCWADGNDRRLSACHPYGDWIDWRAKSRIKH